MSALSDTLAVCGAAFDQLEDLIPDPIRVAKGDDFVFRYDPDAQTPQVVVVQKLSRIASGLQTCLVLLEQGLYQEVGVMFRVLDELNEDVSFMCEAIRSGQPSAIQQRFMADFFQSEFGDEHPLVATQRRDRVPRRKIQAALARVPENPLNPNDAQNLAQTIAKTNSGYVHGTSEHILEMYGGNPPRYHLSGMLGTRHQQVHENFVWYYFHRGLHAFMEAAGAFGRDELLRQLFAYRNVFEEGWGRTVWKNPVVLSQDLKRSKT